MRHGSSGAAAEDEDPFEATRRCVLNAKTDMTGSNHGYKLSVSVGLQRVGTWGIWAWHLHQMLLLPRLF